MKVIVIGSTGLVGSHLLPLLQENTYVTEVIALVRHPRPSEYSKVKFQAFDFNQMNPEMLRGDALFCALGTTIKKAGSKEAQYKVDYSYNAEAAKIAKQQGVRILAHVSSIGADSNSTNFYLRTKGELENALAALHFEKTVITRPSIILGDRREFRLGERIGIILAQLFSPLMVGKFSKYRGVQASKIAAALVKEAFDSSTKGFLIIESDAIQNY